jgi:phosphonate transport system permease protein
MTWGSIAAADVAGPAKRLEAVRVEVERAKRRRHGLLGAAALIAFALALPAGDFSLAKLIEGAPDIAAYVGATLPVLRQDHLLADLDDWYWGIWRYLRLIGETLLTAYLGTLFGLIGALVLCFPAAANLAPHPWLRPVCRRILELARSVPELVYALIFVYAYGVGAMPGVMAVAVHSIGALGKLFSEAAENLDDRSLSGVRATGASWLAQMRLAALPQVLPNFISYTLFRFEINVRSASVLGFVGAGGIGQELYQSIRSFAYADVSAVVLVIVAMVMLTDMASQWVRARFIGEVR